MVEGMPIRESLKELNPNTIDITKVPTLLGRDERIENYYVFFRRNMHKIRSYTKHQPQRTMFLVDLMGENPLRCTT